MDKDTLHIFWLEEGELSLSQREQIESLNRTFFPENLSQNTYLFESKQSFPQRLLLQKEDLIVAHLLSVRRNIKLSQDILNTQYVGELCVHPQYQSTGLGKLLLASYEECIKNTDADLSLLICEPKNIRFYQKCNWSQAVNLSILLGQSHELSRSATGTFFVQLYTPKSHCICDTSAAIFLGESV